MESVHLTESPDDEGDVLVSEYDSDTHDLECGESNPVPVCEEDHSLSLDQPHTTMTPSVEEGRERGLWVCVSV